MRQQCEASRVSFGPARADEGAMNATFQMDEDHGWVESLSAWLLALDQLAGVCFSR